MKLTYNRWDESENEATHLTAARLDSRNAIRDAVARAKQGLLHDYAELAGEHAPVLRLALNEAEALAWQTEYPHLLFPVLATEKAHAAVSWHRRQRALRGLTTELAFPE